MAEREQRFGHEDEWTPAQRQQDRDAWTAEQAHDKAHALGEGMHPVVPDQFERLYAGLDDLREDRGEYAEVQALAHLHDRLDEMQHARQQDRTHEQGMGS